MPGISVVLFIAIAILVIAVSWSSYDIWKHTPDHELILKNLKNGTLLCFFMLFFLSIFLLIVKYFSYYAICALGFLFIIFILIRGFLRKRKAGILISSSIRTIHHKYLLGFGVFYAICTVFQVCLLLQSLSYTPPKYLLNFEIFQVLNFCFITVLFMVAGFGKLEFRENGMYCVYTFIEWRKIDSYRWEPSKPNVLTLRYRIYFFRRFIRTIAMIIPEKDQDRVSQILLDQLPGKNSELN